MKAIRKYGSILIMLTLLVGFASCDDEEDLEERMFGRVWVGDIGLNSDGGRPLYSKFVFNPNGFGEESQYYQYNGGWYKTFPFQWYWDSRYSRNLILDYGRNGISYMDDVDVRRGLMTGIYYFDDYDEGLPFTLEME